ncbi:MAG: Xaa-Pro peptidase family protein [Planctomycetota bacterium]|nr:Xaa-Pro peptidase family protein [Planctomycetota bacterium]MDA1139738.1 Xaa-Pro peptidase family protein [Planctomycetota bacterium]
MSVADLSPHHVLYQTDFTPEEFASRRRRVFDTIGSNAVAVMQGTPEPEGFDAFRQSNEFYYFCGLETSHSYILMDGRTRTTTLYLPGFDEGRTRSEGPCLHSDDPEKVKNLTGVDEVKKRETLSEDLGQPSEIYMLHLASEGKMQCRDTLRHARKLAEADPWYDHPLPEQRFLERISALCPNAEIKDLNPLSDEMRMTKSPREIEMMRKAGLLTGLAVKEAMRSTRPGVMEYQLNTVADYIFLINGARGAGYRGIIGGGTNAWHGHYYRNDCVLNDGDLLLMDYAPDCGNYTSDIGRMWPVNGKFTFEQRELYGYIVEYHKVLLNLIRPHVTAAQIMDEAVAAMRPVFEGWKWSKPHYRAGAEKGFEFRGHLSHPVGMAVHDIGKYREEPLRPGLVIAIDPMIWIPEEKLYIRCEDTIVVTEDGIENLTDAAPLELDDVEQVMHEEGLLQRYPALSS